MKRTLVIVIGVTALVAVGVVLAWLRPEPTGMAIGRLKPAERQMHLKLWSALEPGGQTYLQEWAEELQDPPEDPLMLIDAFNEMAFAVTGPTGFWRKTVPNKFFGCKADPSSPPCMSLKKAAGDFQRWDKLQTTLGKIESSRAARRALKKHGKDMEEYLTTMVPKAEGIDGLQSTPFFNKTLAPYMP